VAFQSRIARNGRGQPEPVCPALNGSDAGETRDMRPLVALPMAVRRLTPRECERLQGFPDDWTLIPFRGKPAADGPRYRALGNSMAVNVMRFIGERIEQVCKL
jgi:DNA (cytosine-5)-methyltransferase 1